MPVYVAKDYDGYVESVVLAHEWTEQNLKDHPTEVLPSPILKTRLKTVHPCDISSRTGSMDLLVVER